MTLLILGEAPPRSSRPPYLPFPAGSASGDMLRLLGAPLEVHGAAVSNLYGRPLPRVARGSAWSATEAAGLAATYPITEELVVLCGRRLARAFGLGALPWYERGELRGASAWVVPHPSPLNRYWNLEINRARARRFFRNLILELRFGAAFSTGAGRP